MTPEQVYANLLQNIAKVEKFLKYYERDDMEVILVNKERMMTAVVTEDGHISEDFSTLTPQRFFMDEALKLRNCYKDIHGKTIQMDIVSDYIYYNLLLERMNDTAKAFQNVYGY